MSIRKAIAMMLALSGCGEVARMSGAESDPGCFGGDGGVCDEEVASAEEELSLGRIGGTFRPDVRTPPGVSLSGVNACTQGALDDSPGYARNWMTIDAQGILPLQRVQICRDGECFWSREFSETTYNHRAQIRDNEPTIFTPVYPLNRVTYSARATDQRGQYAWRDYTTKIGPRTELELLDTVQVVDGPRVGEGVRVFRVHWRGVNVKEICLEVGELREVGLNGAGTRGTKLICAELPTSLRHGPVERVSHFSIWLDELSASNLFAVRASYGSAAFYVWANSVEMEGCQSSTFRPSGYLEWTTRRDVGGPMETPMPPPDEPDPTPAPTPPWMPTCSWTCDTTSPAGWIRTDSRPTRLPDECPTPFQYQICRHDDRPVGNMLSVCSTETTPSNWNTLSFSSDAARCIVSTTGAAMANNVKLIQRRE